MPSSSIFLSKKRKHHFEGQTDLFSLRKTDAPARVAQIEVFNLFTHGRHINVSQKHCPAPLPPPRLQHLRFTVDNLSWNPTAPEKNDDDLDLDISQPITSETSHAKTNVSKLGGKTFTIVVCMRVFN